MSSDWNCKLSWQYRHFERRLVLIVDSAHIVFMLLLHASDHRDFYRMYLEGGAQRNKYEPYNDPSSTCKDRTRQIYRYMLHYICFTNLDYGFVSHFRLDNTHGWKTSIRSALMVSNGCSWFLEHMRSAGSCFTSYKELCPAHNTGISRRFCRTCLHSKTCSLSHPVLFI